jgi:ribosomal protein S18 acetylase RimI-like enzyme
LEFSAARQQDLPQLVELLGILFTQEVEHVPEPRKQRRGLSAILADERIGKIYVARDADKVIAMASLLYSISTVEGGKVAWFEDLIVHPEHRARGIGSALLGFVIAQARNDGLLRITLMTDADNERAKALYRKLGFVASTMQPMRLHLKP